MATGYKMAGDATKMRIVMDFDREPDIKWFLLRGPNRLVIDLANTRFAINAKDLKARGLVKGVRLGALGEGVSRLILTGKGPFAVDKLDVLKNEDGTGYRIAIDMSAASEREFDAALANQALTTGSTVSTDKGGRVGTGPVSNPGHRFTIVSIPAMAASTAAPKASTAPSRRTSRSPSPPNCATSSQPSANTMCS